MEDTPDLYDQIVENNQVYLALNGVVKDKSEVLYSHSSKKKVRVQLSVQKSGYKTTDYKNMFKPMDFTVDLKASLFANSNCSSSSDPFVFMYTRIGELKLLCFSTEKDSKKIMMVIIHVDISAYDTREDI